MIYQEWLADLTRLVTKKHVMSILTASLIMLVGILMARRSGSALSRLSQLDINQRLLLERIAKYGIFIIALGAALDQLGFDLKVLLGAAGVLTVAIGFAAQTSASNLISGLFLMVERPFVVGDVIAIGDFRGEVMSIDLLSSKIRTFTNLMVRVPNETLVKSNIVNHSYFPIRRLDLNIGISYTSDIDMVERLLKDVAHANPLCLDEPQPVFLFMGFAESQMNIQFQVWTLTANITRLQNEIYRDIKRAFDQANIEIPFPTRLLVNSPAPQEPPRPPSMPGSRSGF